jgi:hypothetical protein
LSLRVQLPASSRQRVEPVFHWPSLCLGSYSDRKIEDRKMMWSMTGEKSCRHSFVVNLSVAIIFKRAVEALAKESK